MKHFHADGWGLYYVAWVVLGFLPYELFWAFVDPNNTLSDQWRALEEIDARSRFLWDVTGWGWPHWALAVLLLVFFAWLYVHLIFGIWG